MTEHPGEFVELDEPVQCTFEFDDGRIAEREIGLVGRRGILYTKSYGFACWTSVSERTRLWCMGAEYVPPSRNDPSILTWAEQINQILRGKDSYSIEDEMDTL